MALLWLSGFLLLCSATVESSFEVKLLDGQTERDGVVMVRTEGIWGPVCGAGFGHNEAVAACKTVGYSSGESLCCDPYGTVDWSLFAMRNVSCHDDAATLHDCHYHAMNRSHLLAEVGGNRANISEEAERFCHADEYAAVVCRNGSAPPSSDFQLSIMGASNFTGLLRLTYDGVEGSICGDMWNGPAAELACRQLGFQHGVNYTHYSQKYRGVTGPLWTANVTCNDAAQSFTDCDMVPFGHVSSCKAHHFAGVLCYDDFNHENGGYPYFWLEGDPSYLPSRGRVDVFINGEWGLVADWNWRDEEIHVLCRSLGFDTGKKMKEKDRETLLPLDYHHQMWKVHPHCNRNASSIMDCQIQVEWHTDPNYLGSELAVTCVSQVVLKHGYNDSDGIVLVKADLIGQPQQTGSNEYVPICYDTFSEKDASVVCRELGYVHGLLLCCGEPYGDLAYDLPLYSWYSISLNSQCQGNESHIADCANMTHLIDRDYCPGGKYAAVSCLSAPEAPSYLLSIGYNDVFEYYDWYEEQYDYEYYYDSVDPIHHEKLHNETWGAVSVLYNGITGRICSDGWDNKDAKVACKELGFRSGESYTHYSGWHLWHGGMGIIMWSSNFNCTGSEDALSQCHHDGWGKTRQCLSGHYAGVICYNEDQGVKYRLNSPKADDPYGRLEVLYPGTSQWASICSFWFMSSETADVICRMFGYANGTEWNPRPVIPAGDGPVYQRTAECEGHELHINQCPHDGFVPASDPECRNREHDTGVWCIPHESNTTTTASTTTTTTTTKSKTTFTTTTTTQTVGTPKPQFQKDTTSYDRDVGAIVGGVVGLLVVLGLAGGGIFLFIRYRRKNSCGSPNGSISNIAYDRHIDEIKVIAEPNVSNV